MAVVDNSLGYIYIYIYIYITKDKGIRVTQSTGWEGISPITENLYNRIPTVIIWIKAYNILGRVNSTFLSSNFLNSVFTFMIALMLGNIMEVVIIIENMCTEVPVMYAINSVINICLNGDFANSHACYIYIYNV